MDLVAILAAALAAWLFGAGWYMALSARWIRASGVAVGADGRPANASRAAPYLVSFLAMLVAAAMMRHVLTAAGIAGAGAGLTAGAGLGAFIALPWLATNYAFAGRPAALTLIDGGYAVAGSALMGLVLTLI
ncbi:DUF1761 domain-containing protein [Roseivivax sp. CAU 1761]